MANLEDRVSDLEKKVSKLELEINNSLADIKTTLMEIKTSIGNNDSNADLKHQLIEKDVASNSKRICKIESNQSKFVWTLISEIVGIVSAGILFYIKMG